MDKTIEVESWNTICPRKYDNIRYFFCRLRPIGIELNTSLSKYSSKIAKDWRFVEEYYWFGWTSNSQKKAPQKKISLLRFILEI
jgi:hypothetical protein